MSAKTPRNHCAVLYTRLNTQYSQFTWKFKVDSVYHFIQKQPDGMFVNGSMNW